MNDISKILADLSPEQLQLFQLKLLRLRQQDQDTMFTPVSRRRDSTHEWPLSFSQENLWFLDHLEPGHAFYNIAAAVRLRGPLRPEALEWSVNAIVQRHESLRTTFVRVGGEPRQRIAPSLTLPLPLRDLQDHPEDEREALTRAQILQEAQRPFDLEQGPLLRAHLLRWGEQEYVLTLVMHHIIADGWSMGVLVHELSTYYLAFLQGQPSPLSPLLIQYADYAVWQREWLAGEVLERQQAYWTTTLAGAPALLDLPTDYPRPAVQHYRGAKEAVRISPELGQGVKGLCQQEGVTLFMALLAAWGLLLGRWSGQEDLVIGTPIAGRKRTELEPLIGLFVNTLALRLDLSAQPTFRELVQRVREVALGAYTHQEFPFEKVVEALAPARDLSHQPLFQVMFILQNTPALLPTLTDLQVEPLALDNQTAKFDLELSLSETADGGLEGYLEYCNDLFEPSTIQLLWQQFQSLLEQVFSQPDSLIIHLSLGDLAPVVAQPPDALWLRGYRLHLSQIASVLHQVSGVQQGVVRVVQAAEQEPLLLAAVIPQPGNRLSAEQLSRALRQHLPRYQVPEQILVLGTLPCTATGEVDDVALLALAVAHEHAGEAATPRTPLEEMLVSIWSEVLQVQQVGIHDHFFELGGHSLLAVQVVARVVETLSSQLGAGSADLEGILINALFEEPTIAALASHLEGALEQDQGDSAPALRPVERTGALPLSFTQERLWFLDHLEPGHAFYNIAAAVRLRGPLRPEALEWSVNAIVQRHESLRTTFVRVGGEPRQRIAPSLTLPLPLRDLQDHPEDEREALTRAQILQEAQRPFDLEQGPLLRAHLLRWGEQEYVLTLVMHHIIADGWSMGVLVHELSTYYLAFLQGQPSPLSPLLIQYADYAVWQREWLAGEVLERQQAYWTTTLAGAPALLDLPTDYPRPAVQHYRGAKEAVRISPELGQGVKGLCQQEGVTLFMALLAAWGLLLGRWSGQEDLVIGTPIAGRKRTELEPLIGLFVNTLALRLDLSAQPTFRELVQRVREVALGAYTHQEFPFEKVVEALAPARDLSHQPLFQVMFILQNTPALLPTLTDLDVELTPIDNRTAKFDLTLELFETQDGLQGWLEYNTALFDTVTIKQQIQQFQQILETILAQPDQSVHDVSLLNADQREQILVHWNATQTAYPHTACVHELFEAQVERTPEAIALIEGQRGLNYKQLNQRANQLAHYLRKQGVGPEVTVGLCLERSIEMVIGILGILKAGGAYVPLDPMYPQERLSFMLTDAQVTLVLAQEHLQANLPAWNACVICLDAKDDAIWQEEDANLSRQVTPFNLAYIIYTSGSTGQPKGVMIPHQGLVNYLSWCIEAYDVAHGRGTPVHSSISFDLTVTSLFPSLLVGQRVILLPTNRGVEALNELLEAERQLSLIKITPAHLALLRQQIAPEKAKELTNAFVIGGEALLEQDLDFWRTYAPEIQLINEYGPTEAAVGCCTYVCPTEVSEVKTAEVPIGRPIANVHLYILDQYIQPVPVGAWGELYISGCGLARGYFQQPALTAEKFLPNPFASSTGHSRMYKTGDIVRYRPDGTIAFRGRNDRQMKLRGFRIELGEIEAALKKHPAVREAVVLSTDTSYEARLIAYIVCSPEKVVPNTHVQDFLRQQLPEYMIPAHIIQIETLPLTLNGKLDHARLPKPGQAPSEARQERVWPRDTLELELIRLWEDLLEVRSISVRDDFFKLGGHSFLALRLMQQIERQFGQALPVITLFERPTIEHLADLLRRPSLVRQSTYLVPIKAAGTKPPLFFVHPVGGTVYCYLELAQALEKDQPFYGFQAAGLQGEREPLQTVKAMASCYIEAMKTLQPQGPYHLGGWSMGGVIAFEMAQQLHERGDEITQLILLDSQVPRRRLFKTVKTAELLTDFVIHLVGSSLNGAAQSQYSQQFGSHDATALHRELRQLRYEEQLPFVMERVKTLGLVPINIGIDQFNRFFAIFCANYKAIRSYRPRPYAGGVTIFSVEEIVATSRQGADLGWKRLAKGEIKVQTFPGDHFTLIHGPNVRALVEHFSNTTPTA